MQAIVQALLLPVAQPLVHLNGGLMLMLHAWLLLLLWQRPSGAVPSVGAECVQEKNKLDQRRDEVHPHQQASLPHDSNVHSTVLRHKATEQKRNARARCGASLRTTSAQSSLLLAVTRRMAAHGCSVTMRGHARGATLRTTSAQSTLFHQNTCVGLALRAARFRAVRRESAEPDEGPLKWDAPKLTASSHVRYGAAERLRRGSGLTGCNDPDPVTSRPA